MAHKNIEDRNAYHREYRQKNLKKMRAYNRKYMAEWRIAHAK